MRKYQTLFERLVANSKPEHDNAQACWLYTGPVRKGGYGLISLRVGGKTVSRAPHRLMLEEVLRIRFPHDEAGHLCYNPLCINPSHLEVQTSAMNLAMRRIALGWKNCHKSWIPVIYPNDPLQEAANEAWEASNKTGPCPF